MLYTRRPSAASVQSVSKTNSHDTLARGAQSRANDQTWPLARSSSIFSSAYSAVDANDFDPDEFLTKHTVSEVKAAQQRLRANAEAKQEELRLMVGERYRDLLQASTSIISISNSSKRVLEAFDEMRDIVASLELPRIPKRSAIGEEDKHLQTLQSLSAHLKLLLDAPEHLWRFIEQRKYLHAAWLFLTARLVHRTLLQEDEDIDQSWNAYGIDVSEDIPLVQRQWDIVSQFRSQIVHKATLSLREPAASSGEVCATLLTLHLLESRPLSETLTIFLTQRSKTLFSMLSRNQEQVANGHTVNLSNGNAQSSKKSRKAVIRETRQKLQATLHLVSRTLGTARVVFADSPSGELSMMKQALQHIQAEAPSELLPEELRLTTESLLTGLPSSAHFLLLPSNVRAYKPYVDGSSLSTSIPQGQFQQKQEDYFTKSMNAIRTAMEEWFSSLEKACEVWDVRNSSWNWIVALDGLQVDEKTHIRSVLDDVSQRQVLSVWKSALELAETSFREHLQSALNALDSESDTSLLDSRPVQYLFQSPPMLSAPQAGLNPSQAWDSFQRFKFALQRQLNGRTPLLDDVLATVEQSAYALHEDMNAIRDSGGDAQDLATDLIDSYRPNAEAVSMRMANALEDAVDVHDENDLSKGTVIFVGRIAHELVSSSAFVAKLGCSGPAIDEFKTKMDALHDKMYQRWAEYMVGQLINESFSHRLSSSKTSHRANVDAPVSLRPSSNLMEALFFLSTGMPELGMFVEPSTQRKFTEDTLKHFISSWLHRLHSESSSTDLQDFCDLKFLQRLSEMWGSVWSDMAQELDGLTSEKQTKLLSQDITTAQLEIDLSIAEHLSRMQVLLAPIFPPHAISGPSREANGKMEKTTSLLRYGAPVLEQQFQPAIDLVKPSSRFGLLLIGANPTVR